MRQDVEAAEEKDANDDADAAGGAQPLAADTAAAETAADPTSVPEEAVISEDEDAALERLAGTDATGSPPPFRPPCPPTPASPPVRATTRLVDDAALSAAAVLVAAATAGAAGLWRKKLKPCMARLVSACHQIMCPSARVIIPI